MTAPIDGPNGGPQRGWSRRRILHVAGGVAAAGVAGLGSVVAYDQVYPALAGEPLHTVPDHRVSVSKTTPKLVIARGSDPAQNVAAALARMGGMATFVGAADTVLVKPNVGWARTEIQAANTNPNVVGAVVLACRKAGAKKVIVTDGSVHEPARSFDRSGILDAARRAGADVILPDRAGYVDATIPGMPGRWPVLEPFVRATKIINVPIAKHHGSAVVTAGMKNWIGITRKRRGMFHARLDHAIASLAAMMKPTLTIVDATRVLVRNGPQGGNLDDVKDVGAVAVSLDPVAVDAWATDILGKRKSKVGYLSMGERLGLGKVDYASLHPVEITT